MAIKYKSIKLNGSSSYAVSLSNMQSFVPKTIYMKLLAEYTGIASRVITINGTDIGPFISATSSPTISHTTGTSTTASIKLNTIIPIVLRPISSTQIAVHYNGSYGVITLTSSIFSQTIRQIMLGDNSTRDRKFKGEIFDIRISSEQITDEQALALSNGTLLPSTALPNAEVNLSKFEPVEKEYELVTLVGTDGDFEGNTNTQSGWNTNNASMFTTSKSTTNYLTGTKSQALNITAIATASSIGILKSYQLSGVTDIKVRTGEKFYVKCWVYVQSADTNNRTFNIRTDIGTTLGNTDITITSNKWTLLSILVDVTSTNEITSIAPRLYFTQLNMLNGDIVHFDNLGIFAISDTFGRGNEPTKAVLDNYFTQMKNEYIERKTISMQDLYGVKIKNLLPTGRGDFEADSNSDGRADGYDNYGSPTYTISSDSLSGSKSQQITTNTGGYSGIASYNVYDGSGSNTLPANKVIYISTWVKPLSVSGSPRLSFGITDFSGTYIGGYSSIAPGNYLNQWAHISVCGKTTQSNTDLNRAWKLLILTPPGSSYLTYLVDGMYAMNLNDIFGDAFVESKTTAELKTLMDNFMQAHKHTYINGLFTTDFATTKVSHFANRGSLVGQYDMLAYDIEYQDVLPEDHNGGLIRHKETGKCLVPQNGANAFTSKSTNTFTLKTLAFKGKIYDNGKVAQTLFRLNKSTVGSMRILDGYMYVHLGRQQTSDAFKFSLARFLAPNGFRFVIQRVNGKYAFYLNGQQLTPLTSTDLVDFTVDSIDYFSTTDNLEPSNWLPYEMIISSTEISPQDAFNLSTGVKAFNTVASEIHYMFNTNSQVVNSGTSPDYNLTVHNCNVEDYLERQTYNVLKGRMPMAVVKDHKVVTGGAPSTSAKPIQISAQFTTTGFILPTRPYVVGQKYRMISRNKFEINGNSSFICHDELENPIIISATPEIAENGFQQVLQTRSLLLEYKGLNGIDRPEFAIVEVPNITSTLQSRLNTFTTYATVMHLSEHDDIDRVYNVYSGSRIVLLDPKKNYRLRSKFTGECVIGGSNTYSKDYQHPLGIDATWTFYAESGFSAIAFNYTLNDYALEYDDIISIIPTTDAHTGLPDGIQDDSLTAPYYKD